MRKSCGLTIALLVLLGLTGARVFGQNLEGSGYLEHQVYPQRLQGRLIAMDYTRIRVDVNAN
ncbi:MAG: hypothetical protein WBW88_02920, partial [Rhodothermales bacterium]